MARSTVYLTSRKLGDALYELIRGVDRSRQFANEDTLHPSAAFVTANWHRRNRAAVDGLSQSVVRKDTEYLTTHTNHWRMMECS